MIPVRAWTIEETLIHESDVVLNVFLDRCVSHISPLIAMPVAKENRVGLLTWCWNGNDASRKILMLNGGKVVECDDAANNDLVM